MGRPRGNHDEAPDPRAGGLISLQILHTPEQDRQQFPDGGPSGALGTCQSARKPLICQESRPQDPIKALPSTVPIEIHLRYASSTVTWVALFILCRAFLRMAPRHRI